MTSTRRRRILLAAPFVILPLVARLAVGPIATRVAAVALNAAPSRSRVADEATFDSDDPPAPAQKSSPRRPSRSVVVARDAGAPGADGGAPPKPASVVVPAGVVAQAMTDRAIRARNAVDEAGKPIGVRLRGVSRYGTGIQDGDVIVSVAGTPTPTTDALVFAGSQAVAQGARRLAGKMLRDGAVFDVVLEVPPLPKSDPTPPPSSRP